MEFDENLKLAIISTLIENNLLNYDKDKYQEIRNKFLDEDLYMEPIPELVDFFLQLDISPCFDKIEKLEFTVNAEIYELASYEWEAQDDSFKITSLKGIENLINLKEFNSESMVDYFTSLEPLTHLKKIEVFVTEYPCFKDYQYLELISSLKKVELSNTYTMKLDSLKELPQIVENLKSKGVEVNLK